MSDDRVAGSRSFSDASSSLLLVDTRASQSLEPIRLPAKLRDRVERAQRRANAAKDGVSIFTKDSKDSAMLGPPVGRRSATAPSAESTTAATFGDPRRASTATGANGAFDDKMHLPDVVLSHKMRDFEARANTGGGVALFSVEPADRSLQRLSLEDRERVMLVMQGKIRQIASDVDANFARITKELNANGIFDSAANIQRAQTLCLVDLQRRCKLERLRDEALREVLHLSTSATTKSPTKSVGGAKPSHKLSQLLNPSNRRKSTEMASPAIPMTISRRKRKPARVSKLPAIRKKRESPSKSKSKTNQTSSSPTPLQGDNNNEGNKTPSPVRMLTRRGGLAPPSTNTQVAAREDVSFTTNDGDLYARHPHVTQVLQSVATGENSHNKTSNGFNVNSAEADMENARMLDAADEWSQRSASYQAVGARAAEAVRRCGERQRWDTLGHFVSNWSHPSVGCIPVAFRQRLEDQHSAWRKGEDTPRSEEGENDDGVADSGKGSKSQQQQDNEIYAELQARIRERLISSERRTRTAAAAVRVVGNSGRMRQLPQTAPTKSSSTASLLRGNQQHSLQVEVPPPTLAVSVSEPTLSVSVPTRDTSEAKSSSPSRHARGGSRVRVSVLEQMFMADSSQPNSRHARRKESRIGAPRSQLDSRVIGHHSEARLAYRRDTAQTWAWHQPPGTTDSPVDTIAEEEEERNEGKDHFDEGGCGQLDEEDDYEEDEDIEEGTEFGDDDVESIDSSRTSFSARSTMSMSSVKRRTSNGNRKHGKSKRPQAVQRRASRGAGGRSAGISLTGHALSLHARLEVIWRVLQFPYSNKLTMLERLSTLQDADAFVSALEHWERVTPLVAIRQRMKLALSGFAERGDLRPSEWLTASEFAVVSALPQPSEPALDTIPPLNPPSIDSLSPADFVDWVRKHIDVVTLQTQKLANDLKVHTGEGLQFQGFPYPRRG